MSSLPKAQGDLLVIKDDDSIAIAMAPTGKRQVIHLGEGRDHGHVLVGSCAVSDRRTEIDGIKAWTISVPKGQKVTLQHQNMKSGKLTKEHGTVTLEPGQHQIRTQRSYDLDQAPIRVMD